MMANILKLIFMSLMVLSLVACIHDDVSDAIDAANAVDPGTSSASDLHGDTIASATDINDGVDTGTLNTSTDIDMFTVFCATTCTITAASGGATDTFGRILNVSGAPLLENDDSGTDFNFSLQLIDQPAGTYFIEVTGCCGGTGDTGFYSIAVLVS